MPVSAFAIEPAAEIVVGADEYEKDDKEEPVAEVADGEAESEVVDGEAESEKGDKEEPAGEVAAGEAESEKSDKEIPAVEAATGGGESEKIDKEEPAAEVADGEAESEISDKEEPATEASSGGAESEKTDKEESVAEVVDGAAESVKAVPVKAESVSIIVDGVDVSDKINNNSLMDDSGDYDFSKLDLSADDIFENGEDDAYLVSIGDKMELVGDTTLKRWVGNWETWQSYIYPDAEMLTNYPYLEDVWETAYDAYIAAFYAVSEAMGQRAKAMYPDSASLKEYWYRMTGTNGVSSLVVADGETGCLLTWIDVDGGILAQDSYTMTGKMRKGLEGAIMYIFTADTLSEGSSYKYFVTMVPGMEGDSAAPIAAHYHFQFGSSLDDLLVFGQDYNGVQSNIQDTHWYATMISADDSVLSKYNVILSMHRAAKWKSLPSQGSSSSSTDSGSSSSTDDNSSLSTDDSSSLSTGGSSSSSTGGGSGSNKDYGIKNRTDETKGSWEKDGEGWRFQRQDGTYPKEEWVKASGTWYYFGLTGYMATDWNQIGGNWYFMDQNGAMKTDWILWDGAWYYLKTDGSMATGWTKVQNEWYYLNHSGECLMNTITPDGYRVDENGAWV